MANYASNKLSKTLQRYENKSKSQQQNTHPDASGGCLRLCKDTKIKANHNAERSAAEEISVV